MGKNKASDSDEEDNQKKKKKKDSKKKNKKDAKKVKKDKKKKKKGTKKAKKAQSSNTSSSSESSQSEEEVETRDTKKRKKDNEKDAEAAQIHSAADVGETVADPPAAPVAVELPPPEEGIRRFEFTADEVGPLGLRFSGGFPPLILAVNPDSFASKKGIPANFEVHAINGLPLLPENRDTVMSSLKSRPVLLDVRPQGWKPKEKVKELEKKRQREEAERQALIQVEEQRREQVAREAAEQAERDAAERALREEQERREQEELEKRAKEARLLQKAREEEFQRILAADPEELRRAATELMEADYGSVVKVQGRRGLPLRLLTRRREVAWLWAGEVQELIGGGAPEAGDTWS